MLGLLTLEDLEGSISVFFPADIFRQSQMTLAEQGPFLVEGYVEKDERSHRIRVIAKRIHLLS
jgi:DNA polymerase III alpha subunit